MRFVAISTSSVERLNRGNLVILTLSERIIIRFIADAQRSHYFASIKFKNFPLLSIKLLDLKVNFCYFSLLFL